MKKILTILIFSGLAWAVVGQTPYDTVNVYDPQNFTEMTTIDTAYGQIISRKGNLNRRIGLQTVKDWVLEGPTGLFNANNNGDTVRVSSALLRAAYTLTSGTNSYTITSSSPSFGTTISNTSSGTGLLLSTITGGPLYLFQNNPDSTTITTLSIIQRATSGTATNGLGGRLLFSTELATGSYTSAAYLDFGLDIVSDVTASSGFLSLYTKTPGGAITRKLNLDGDGQLTLDGYAAAAFNTPDSVTYVLGTSATGGEVWQIPVDSLGGSADNHNNLEGLNDGDYIHLTASEYAARHKGSGTAGTISIWADTDSLANSIIKEDTSLIFPTVEKSIQIFQQNVGPSTNDMPLEIANYGYSGHGPTDSIHYNKTGLWRLNGRLQLGRNVEWDSVNGNWNTPIHDASAYGSVVVELGGEAAILHATPSGVDYSDVPHEILLASAGGTDAESANDKVSDGYYIQAKAPLFARYSSAAYVPSTTAKSWNPSTADDPMLWLSSGEAKGSGGALNEYARFEANSGTAGIYGAAMFAKSGGTLASRTAVTTGQVIGQIGFSGYDGADYETTAAIEGVTRGTIASNQVPMDIRFTTSATNTASRATRLEITNDGKVQLANTPLTYKYSSITTIPDYSGFTALSPTPTTSTLGYIQHLSTSTGGLRMYGLSTNSTSTSAIAVSLMGILGSNSPTAPAILLQARKHDGATNATTLADSEIVLHVNNVSTNLIEVLGSGRTGFGVTSPTANVHIKAGTATASTAPLKIEEGTNLTTPEDGAIEHTSDNLHFTAGTTRYTLAKTLTNTAALDFDLTSVNYEDLTITVTGAADGDAVSVGVPNASATANVIYTWWVSATNTVTVRASRIDVASGANPASGTFRASVIKY